VKFANVYDELYDSNIYVHEFGITSVLLNTPKFLLKRPTLPTMGKLSTWNNLRETELFLIAKEMKEDEIISLQKYLEDSFICKNGYSFQLNSYEKIYNDFKNDIHLFNSISINQNIIESLTVINDYDQINQTLHLIDSITHLLLNKITYTGALDSWNNKILHNKIIDFVLSYHSTNIIAVYLNTICKSPIRNSLYTEFDLANICFKKEFDLLDDKESALFAIMNLPVDNYLIKPNHFRDYLLLSLSENYFISFNEKQRNDFVDKIIKDLGNNFEKMVEDSIKLTFSKDFTFFQEKFNQLSEKIITRQITGIHHDSLSIIVKDYFRIQTAQRMKTFLRKPDLKLDAMDYFDYASEEYKLHTIIKHERRINVMTLEEFFKDALSLANYLNDTKLISKINEYQDNVWTERPPQQKTIPSYIKYWRNQKDKSWKNDESWITIPQN